MKILHKIIKIVLMGAFVFQSTSLRAEPVNIGTTYSDRQSEYLGLDSKKTYLYVLDAGFDIIRLGAYWNEIEKEEDVYDFTALDWQITKAREKEIPVVLTVGMKAPRWPEYFIPDWVMKKISLRYAADISENEYLRERTLKFLKKTVERYRDEKIVRYWQVENEPLNRFGEKYWYIGSSFLKEEVDLVKRLDKENRPIVLTASTYPNRFLRFFSRMSTRHDPIAEALELCDILGLNVYPTVGHRFWKIDLYFKTSRAQRREYFSSLLNRIKNAGRAAWIVEFQAEPWEAGQLVHMGSERPSSISPGEIKKTLKEFHSLGFDDIFLWGAEYWYFRALRHDDTEWLSTVRNIIDASKK